MPTKQGGNCRFVLNPRIAHLAPYQDTDRSYFRNAEACPNANGKNVTSVNKTGKTSSRPIAHLATPRKHWVGNLPSSSLCPAANYGAKCAVRQAHMCAKKPVRRTAHRRAQYASTAHMRAQQFFFWSDTGRNLNFKSFRKCSPLQLRNDIRSQLN